MKKYYFFSGMAPLEWAVVANGDQVVAINRIVSHPFATKVRGFHQNDIALIELTHSLEFDELVQPICLGDQKPQQGDMCIIAGWIQKEDGKTYISIYRKLAINNRGYYSKFIFKTIGMASFQERPQFKKHCHLSLLKNSLVELEV